MTREHHLTTSDAALPDVLPELRRCDQWVGWRTEYRDDKPTKVPVDIEDGGLASTADADTWTDFATAYRALETADIDGVGFVFTDEDTFAGVDLDNCVDADTGAVEQFAASIVEDLDSYTEFSPSETGLHVIARGFLPPNGNRSGPVEMYDRGRFFTVTGVHVATTPTEAAVRHDELQTVHGEHVGSDTLATGSRPETAVSASSQPSSSGAAGERTLSEMASEGPGTDLAAEEILTRARSASNSGKFQRLWDGDTSGYPSHSEADMALCTMLAFWTGGSPDMIDNLFKRSGLMREKWTAQRGERTYGELTIQKAIRTVDEYYRPSIRTRGTTTKPDDESKELDVALGAPHYELGTIQPETVATVTGTVARVSSHRHEQILQIGQFVDDTASVAFIMWQEPSGDVDRLRTDTEYQLRNVWVDTYREELQLNINSRTEVYCFND